LQGAGIRHPNARHAEQMMIDPVVQIGDLIAE
jgi:hypothetical protein